MVYLVIGIVLAMAVGAIFTQRARQTQEQQVEAAPEQQQAATTGGEAQTVQASDPAPSAADTAKGADAPDTVLLSPGAGKREEAPPAVTVQPAPLEPAATAGTGFGLEEEIIPLKPVLAAEPLSSPNALNSATYTSQAQTAASKESPYAYGNTVENTKPKPEATLLRWSGKTGSLQIGDLTIRGPVTYWSDGPSSTPEPSCIDIQLPVEYPGGDLDIPPEGAASYHEMTPFQRGVYLRWLAGGRIQPPAHACYPIVWLFGLERRVLADRLDMGICLGEAFRLLPLMRWESLRQGLIKFITWLAAKLWMPEEELLAFSRSLSVVPKEILNMLLWPYADARLPLPSVVAFTVMRTSSLAADQGIEQPQPFLHSDELMGQFALKYKSKCEGGLVIPKPKSSVFVAYVPSNPALIGDKKASGGVLELPDFFKETGNFDPLIAAWRDFLKSAFPPEPEPLKALDELKARPDWDFFVKSLQEAENTEDTGDGGVFTAPVVTDLGALGNLMGIPRTEDSKKIDAADRKKISEAAKVEGVLVIPDLGIAGKEYHWDESVSLAPFPAGERLSQDYSAAALTLEYACALTGLSDLDALASMKTGLEEYFTLSVDDSARLEALASILTPPAETRGNPGNLGESMQFWLQREQRVIVGEFMAQLISRFFGLPGLPPAGQDWLSSLRESLGVDTIQAPAPEVPDAEIQEEENKEAQPRELGNKVVQALAPLFKE